MRENGALNSDARLADLFDIILRWNTGYKERGEIGSNAEKGKLCFLWIQSLIDSTVFSSFSSSPFLLVALFPQSSRLLFSSVWSCTHSHAEAHLNVASTGACNKMAFNCSLYSLAPSRLPSCVFLCVNPARPCADALDSRLPLFITLSFSLRSVFPRRASGLGGLWGQL